MLLDFGKMSQVDKTVLHKNVKLTAKVLMKHSF